MKRQRGVIATFYLYALVALLVIAALTGLILAWNSYTARLDKQGYDRGRSEEKAVWQNRENVELQEANALILTITDVNRKLERSAATATQQANDARRKKDEAEQKLQTAAAAAVRAGLGRLCEPATTPAGQSPGSSSASATTGATGGTHGAGTSELLGAFAGFLTAEAVRANGYARKLSQAQSLILLDRATCNTN